MSIMGLVLTGSPVKIGSRGLAQWFDQASGTWAVTDATAPTIRITPLLDVGTVPPKTQWFAIRSQSWTGKTPIFQIDKASFWFTISTDFWVGAWATAADTDTWHQFDNVTVGATDIEFSHNTAFPSGTIYVAMWPMYPFSRTQRLVGEWAANALVGETTSTTNKIIDLSSAPAAPDDNGRAPSGLPYYAFKIANATANTKNKAIISSRMHAAEPIGGWSFEGAVNYLLTTSVEQEFLLDWFDFYAYPCLYPINVVAGHSRDDWDDYTVDVNRLWSTTGTDEAIDTFKTAMAADTGGALDVGLDYHSYATTATGIGDVENAAGTMELAYRDQFRTLDATFALLDEDLPQSLHHWWTATLGADLAVVAEHGLPKTKGITDWKTYGANSVKTLVKMLAMGYFANGPGVGSRDFNGTTDRINYANAANTAGSALTISAWVNIDAYIVNPNTAYILSINRAGDTAYATVFAVTWNGRLVFFRSGTTGIARYSLAANPVGTGAWAHVLMTHDGVMTTYSSVHLYINGVDRSDNTDAVNGAGEYAATGLWSIGGRTYDDVRNVNGKIAQVATWNRVLTAGEIANLAAGYAPGLIASGLQFYFAGNTNSLEATPGGTGTADGTTHVTGVGNGPAIIYP